MKNSAQFSNLYNKVIISRQVSASFFLKLWSQSQYFLTKHRIVLVQHFLNFPDLALCDFFLFPKQKTHFMDKI